MAIDVFQNLQDLRVNGQTLPCVKMGLGFENRLGVYPNSYGSAGPVDSLGADNKLFSYVIPFRENFKEYPALFSKSLPIFMTTIQGTTSFELVDPIDGAVMVKCKSFARDSEMTNGRDGVDVQVTFIESPSEPEKKNTTLSLSDNAKKINTSLAALPDDLTALKTISLDQQIGAIVSQAVIWKDMTINKIMTEIGKVTRILNLLDDLFKVQPISEAFYYPLYTYCQTYLATSYDILDKRIVTIRLVRSYETKAPHNIIELASILNNTVAELLDLNVNVGETLDIPKGTFVQYYES